MPVIRERGHAPLKHLLYWLFWVVFGAGFIGVFWLFAPVSLAMLALAGMMLFVGALTHCLRHGPIAGSVSV